MKTYEEIMKNYDEKVTLAVSKDTLTEPYQILLQQCILIQIRGLLEHYSTIHLHR